MGECIEFLGKRDKDGYGTLQFEGKKVRAHRLAFFKLHRWWPPVVRHTCDNPPCWNQTHLLGGTQADNMHDMVERGRQGRRGREGDRRGRANGRAKLDDHDVVEIRKLYDTGMFTQRQIGNAYDVTNALVSMIVRRKIWSHVK